MEGGRRGKDRSYKNVFKGSVLVSTLMEHDHKRFSSRNHAVKFAQRLMDLGHLQSVVESKTFDDSVRLYRWCDESVVRDAKKMVLTSGHIPRKKLIELVELHQMDGTEECSTVKEKREKLLSAKDTRPPTSNAKESRLTPTGGRELRSPSSTEEKSGDVIIDQETYHDNRRQSNESLTKTTSRSRKSPNTVGGRNGETRSNLSRKTSISSDGLLVGRSTNFYDIGVETADDETWVGDLSKPRSNSDTTNYQRTVSEINGFNTNDSSVSGKENNKHAIEQTDSPDVPKLSHSPLSTAKMEEIPPKTDEEELEDIATCKYDGIEMAALDIENIDFTTLRPDPKESMAAINQSLENLAEQSHSYSDNEKQLLEQMKKMQAEHENVVKTYEDRINELMLKINDLKGLADLLESNKNQAREGGSSEKSLLGKIASKLNSLGDKSKGESSSSGKGSTAAKSAPPAPPPPPPTPRSIQPTKPAIKPRVKMRPLFWTRIILDPKTTDGDIFWQNVTEPNLDIDDFERLFGRDVDKEARCSQSLHDAMSAKQGKGKVETAKILEEKRSRAVAIRLRSMHCQMDDIRCAVYGMDFSKIDLDSLQALYEIRGTPSELDKIMSHVHTFEDVPLDQPEEFLLELSQMSHFAERMECMVLKKHFNETLFNIDQHLTAVQTACEELRKSEPLKTTLELVLAFGNYMNGGTQRGQADGFDMGILAKLKDVKSMTDNNFNLMHYLMRVYSKDYQADAGKGKTTFCLIEPSKMTLAAQVSFTEKKTELHQLGMQLKVSKKKAECVCLDTEPQYLQPFKDQMDDFFDSAHDMLKRQVDKLTETELKFRDLLRFLAVKDPAEQTTPESFFVIWAQFFEDCRQHWLVEQRRIARENFEAVVRKRKNRMEASRRRNSLHDNNKSNLKERFAEMRRRSGITHTVKMLRSQSVSSIDTMGMDSDNDTESNVSNRPRRRRRPYSAFYDSPAEDSSSETKPADTVTRRRRSRDHTIDGQQETEANNPSPEQEPRVAVTIPVIKGRDIKVGDSSSMKERMERVRRRSQDHSESYTSQTLLEGRQRRQRSSQEIPAAVADEELQTNTRPMRMRRGSHEVLGTMAREELQTNIRALRMRRSTQEIPAAVDTDDTQPSTRQMRMRRGSQEISATDGNEFQTTSRPARMRRSTQEIPAKVDNEELQLDTRPVRMRRNTQEIPATVDNEDPQMDARPVRMRRNTQEIPATVDNEDPQTDACPVRMRTSTQEIPATVDNETPQSNTRPVRMRRSTQEIPTSLAKEALQINNHPLRRSRSSQQLTPEEPPARPVANSRSREIITATQQRRRRQVPDVTHTNATKGQREIEPEKNNLKQCSSTDPLTDLAGHKPAKDRSPLPTTPKSTVIPIQHFTKMALKSQSQFTSNGAHDIVDYTPRRRSSSRTSSPALSRGSSPNTNFQENTSSTSSRRTSPSSSIQINPASSGRSAPPARARRSSSNPPSRVRSGNVSDADVDSPTKIHYREDLRRASRQHANMFDGSSRSSSNDTLHTTGSSETTASTERVRKSAFSSRRRTSME